MDFLGCGYTDMVVELGVVDVLICYTDGLSEAVDAAGRQLGGDGFIDLAHALPVTELTSTTSFNSPW